MARRVHWPPSSAQKKSELSLSYTLTFQIFEMKPFVRFEHLEFKTKTEFQLYADLSLALEANRAWQDGRSASLTAPNGPAQEEMVTRVTPPGEKCGMLWRFPYVGFRGTAIYGTPPYGDFQVVTASPLFHINSRRSKKP